MTLPGVPRILEDEVLDEGNPVCGPAFQRDPGPLNPCAGSLDPPQYTLDVFSSRHGLPLRALLHWEKTANLPLMNTHTHTWRYGREAPENGVGSIFYTFCPFSRKFVAAGTGSRGPKAHSVMFANFLEFTICREI
jgi:hypothetical protein